MKEGGGGGDGGCYTRRQRNAAALCVKVVDGIARKIPPSSSARLPTYVPRKGKHLIGGVKSKSGHINVYRNIQVLSLRTKSQHRPSKSSIRLPILNKILLSIELLQQIHKET